MQEELVVPERVALLADVKYKTQSGSLYTHHCQASEAGIII
jgi:hypothetical protein